MLVVNIWRTFTEDEALGTFGDLRISGMDFRCKTGELPWRGNRPGVSCTESGEYVCTVRPSAHFRRPLYHLEDRDGRVNEEIHNGNWCGDVAKGYRSDVEGCILLGFSVGDVMRPDNVFQKGVAQSVHALEQFMKATQEQPIRLVIQWNGFNPEVQPRGA